MHTSIRLAVAATIGLVVLAGCDKVREAAAPQPTDNGVAALSADEIVAKSQAALSAAKSYRIKGGIVMDQGEHLGLDVKTRGSDLGGTFTMSGGPSGGPEGTVEALRVNGKTLFKGDAVFWKSVAGKDEGDTAAKLLAGKWVVPKADNKFFPALLRLTDPEALLKSDGTVTKGEAAKVGDRDAITLKDGESTLYVATKGEPYPLRLEGPAGQGQAEFSDFGAAFEEIKEPPAEQVVDMSKLKS